MKTKKRWKLFTTLIALGASLMIVCVPLSALADSTESSNDTYDQESIDNLLVPKITKQEFDNKVLMNGLELPDEFIIADSANPLLRSATLGHQKWTKVKTTRLGTKVFLKWHPSFKGWTPYTSGYYFSASASVSASISFGYGPVGFSIAKGNSAGTFYAANKKKITRPAVYGNKNKIKWSVKHYNGANIYQKTTTEYTGSVSGTFIKIRNK